MSTYNLSDKHVATVDFDLITASCIVAQLQLASRHPRNTGPSRQIAELFARELQARIVEVAPENTATLEMGWNPDFDTE